MIDDESRKSANKPSAGLASLERIADALGCSVADLMNDSLAEADGATGAELLRLFVELGELGRTKLLDYARDLRAQQ